MGGDRVVINVGGRVQATWVEYDVESDLMVPADAWRVTLRQSSIEIPAEIAEGASVQVQIERDGVAETVMSGRIDTRRLSVSKRAHTLHLSGRDGAAQLLDCSAPILSLRSSTLEQVVTAIVGDFGVRRLRIDADTVSLEERFSTEPGETGWRALQRVAESQGLWPWFEPDGTLVIGGPRYDVPPVASLILAADGKGNNVIELDEERSLIPRFSEVRVLSQSPSTGTGAGERGPRSDIMARAYDTGVPVHRPHYLEDHQHLNETAARARARKVISDGRVNGYTLRAVVPGHRTQTGILWKPGQRVTVKSEPHGIDGVFFLMGRRFSMREQGGQVTSLTLKEDGAWVLDAHKTRRKSRRGKNALPGKVLNVSPLGQ